MNVQEISIHNLRQYENNPRNNDDSVDAVANSIKSFGFKIPLIVDKNNVIVCGHTRYRAALKLGFKTLPCIIADDLSPAQIKAFRLADNKVAELSKWDNALLVNEIADLATFDINLADFGFDTSDYWKRQQAWKKAEKFCDLKKKIKFYSHGGFFTTCFFEVGKKGIPISEIKENPANVAIFADCFCDYLSCAFGSNLTAGSWCIATTPRRRHKQGFHFSTAICNAAAEILRLPFYIDSFEAKNRNRINPEFHLLKAFEERNVILFDDIISTGETIRTCRQLLLDAGYIVFPVVGIKNSSKTSGG